MRREHRVILIVAALLLVLRSAGCTQLETRVTLHEDGSATITERLRFSRRLLDLDDETGPALERLLSRGAALQRMEHMGKGIRLAKHEVRDADKRSRESLAVFEVSDLNGFRYVSPWLAYVDFPENNVVECRLSPQYRSKPYAEPKAGEMVVYFRHLSRPKAEPRPDEDAPPPKGPAPLELQLYRELGPVFRDILQDFRLKFTFETYSPVLRCGLGFRGYRVAANHIDLINVSDKDLDKYGDLFLRNEELMLDLVRWELGSQDVVEHVRGFVNNHTLPLFVPAGSKYMWWTGGSGICFKPSRALFDKHFKGKKLDYAAWGKGSPPEKLVPAVFEKIGWQKASKTKKSD